MARTRIVLETSDRRKSAMMEAADLQGATLVDWFEEQVKTVIPNLSEAHAESVRQPSNPEDLLDTSLILSRLCSRDWAFTDEDTRYLTHDLHPYPAKFIPQIPTHLIASLSMCGDVVCDPFGGSATTAVEAVRQGRRAISLDANPLAALIGRVKTGYMTSAVRTDLEQLIAAVEAHIISPSAGNTAWSEYLIERHKGFVPDIPNITKWFRAVVIGELALIRHLIQQATTGLARDAALLALSRVLIRVSNQESETRYVSVAKKIASTLTLRAYLESLRTVTRRLEAAAADLQFADARFLTGDSRFDLARTVGENTIDLIVTSPPYPNATDYHLYHRFRLFWLGFDPRDLGQIEIGSHLRHQRNDTGFEEYRDDMAHVLQGCGRVLQPGRYAVFVVGDALFKGETFSTSSAICDAARDAELTVIGTIDRPIHETKRSFAMPARRARQEQLVILQRPNRRIRVQLNPPAYKMWKYEEKLRAREIESITGTKIGRYAHANPITLTISQPALWKIRRLTFTKDYVLAESSSVNQPTWQKVIENGDGNPAKRKDPKYATHGLHPFKGKFYPQLVKSLLNMSEAPLRGCLLDPFCGSGTTLLEGMLNGYSAFGCDFNPLAARIARAKTAILSVPRDVTDLAVRALLERLTHRPPSMPSSLDQFPVGVHGEIRNWFPTPVIHKLNWLLTQIRMFGNETLVGFFEMLVSSLIREVSQQDTADLRIRRRKQPIEDADVFGLFKARLEDQQHRLQKYWAVAGRQPGPLISPMVVEGDCRRHETMNALGLQRDSIDCVVTSPPYATALPYIDTDRLSLLAILGLPSTTRSELEEKLTGSREIRQRDKQESENALFARSALDVLPRSVVESIRRIHKHNASSNVGFRRANMPALLWRYFVSMQQNLAQVSSLLKTHAKAFYVVGNSRTNSGGEWINIETCKYIATIGELVGLRHLGSINIDVTRENYKHIRNAITENEIIIFEKS